MSFTSFTFFCLVAATVIVYYILPVKIRWITLLFSDAAFIYFANGDLKLVLIMLLTAVIAYLTGLLTDLSKSKGKTGKAVTVIGVLLITVLFVGIKDCNFFINCFNGITHGNASLLSIAAPLGVSYYSLMWIGYALDVYWGTCPVEKNPLKFLVFAGYFPLLTSGPIVKFQEVGDQITSGHKFDYTKFCFGLQRMVWGLMKKLVISERLSTIVNTVYADPVTYSGAYVFLAMLLFVLQLYTDFSGCVDIAMGCAEMLGVDLPENFNLPFLSKTIAEFWRRWHITLGAWLRDYILYPILKSSPWQAMGKACKKRFGKKWGKKIPTWIGLFISWFIIGFWHSAAWNYILGVGVFMWAVIVLGEATEPLWKKVKSALRISDSAVWFQAFQVVRTYLIFTVGLSMFRCYEGMGQVKTIWKSALSTWNPGVLFDGSICNLGLDYKDLIVLAIFLGILILSGIVRAVKKMQIREVVAGWNIVIRWILYLLLFYSVVIFGCYGNGYDASAFIYGQF